MMAATENTDINQPLDPTGFHRKPVRSDALSWRYTPFFQGLNHGLQIFGGRALEERTVTEGSAFFGVYLYTPYSLAVSTMALTFSGFA